MTRTEIHNAFVTEDADWMYNRHAVGPGADEADAPVTMQEADEIADMASENGVDDHIVDEWLAIARQIIGEES